MSKQVKGIMCVVGGASLWGGSGAAAQYLFANTDINTVWLVSLRMITAGILLTAYSLWHSRSQVHAILHSRHNFLLMASFAIFGMLNSQLTYFLAVKYSNAPTATVIQYLQPVIIIIWVCLSQHHWPQRIDVISIIIALVGTFYLVTGGHLGTLTLTTTAIFWGVWCAFAAALYTLIPESLLKRFDAVVVCGLAMLTSGICMLPFLLTLPRPHLDALGWILVIYIIIFGTAVAYSMFLQSLRYIAPSVSGILSAFEPLVATLLAVTLLGTRLTGASILGSFLILFTTILQAIPLNRIWGLRHFHVHHSTK